MKAENERKPAADARFLQDLQAIIPSLRGFARLLVSNRDLADDVVQETLLRAWAARTSFEPGTNFKAWMFRILRNHYFTLAKRERRVTSLDPEVAERTLVAVPGQEGPLHLQDLERGLDQLPPEQREVLLLFGVHAMSYEQIAEMTGVPIGTVRSRLSRGRSALERYMNGAEPRATNGPVASGG